jgi:hypothetical protein
MSQRIEKADAMTRMKERPSGRTVNRRNTHFANINSQKEVWWFDIPCSKIAVGAVEDINLLLFDHRTNELHHLIVPTAYLRANLNGLVVRGEKGTISLELSAEVSNMFQDVRPTGGGIKFRQFVER